MDENKDKKTLSGKLQLKKTINAGQIKQSFLMAEVDLYRLKLRKKNYKWIFKK